MSSDIEAFEATVKNDYVVSLTDFLSELPNMKSKHDNQDLLQLIDQSVPPFRSIRDQVRDRLEEIDASGDMRAKAKSWKLRSHLLYLDRSLEKIEQVRRECGGGGGSSSNTNRDSTQNEAEQIQHVNDQQPQIANVAAAAAPQREEDISHSGSRQDFPMNEVHIKTGEGGVVSDASGNSGSPSAGFEDDTVTGRNSIDGSNLDSEEEEDHEDTAKTSEVQAAPFSPRREKPVTSSTFTPRKKKRRHIALCGKCQESAFKVSEAWMLVPESVAEHGKLKADGNVPTHLSMHLICTDCHPRNGNEFLDPKVVVGGIAGIDKMSMYVYSMASRIEYERALNGGKSLYGPAGQEYVPPIEYM